MKLFSCMGENVNVDTVVKIKSNCFRRPVILYISNDDEDTLNHLQEMIEKIESKKKRNKENIIV